MRINLNARVMSYLLQPENNRYACARDNHGLAIPNKRFLELLDEQTPKIRVLLDVGAQMVDMTNVQLAQCWLGLTRHIVAQAVVFFNDDHELMVLTREGSIDPLLTSSFHQQLDRCLVYLDDAHTRGTDLKLPTNCRAAVTLGPKVTKDRLLQGCMRMRQLGAGQSVMFVAPPEVDYSIRLAMHGAGKSAHLNIQSVDILRWCMLETCKSITHHLADWYHQGIAFQRREQTWSQLLSTSTGSIPFDQALRNSWLEVDSRTLQSLYGVSTASNEASTSRERALLPTGIERLVRCGLSPLSVISLDEEQEREVDHEVEMEREQEAEHDSLPVPRKHDVHPDVRRFIRTGTMLLEPQSSLAFTHALFKDSRLLQTVDLARSIADPTLDTAAYRKSVQWVCSSTQESVLVLLSPFEVNALLSTIRDSANVHLHIYSPRISRSSRAVDDLRFHVIPPLPLEWIGPSPRTIMELNLWAGQLFFTSYDDYQTMAMYLGLYTLELKAEYPNVAIQADGFILPRDRVGPMRDACKYETSPLPWLKEHLSQRRKGMDIFSTHMGKILRGRCLTRDDF